MTELELFISNFMFYMYAPLLEFLASNYVQIPGSQKQRSTQSQISAKNVNG